MSGTVLSNWRGHDVVDVLLKVRDPIIFRSCGFALCHYTSAVPEPNIIYIRIFDLLNRLK